MQPATNKNNIEPMIPPIDNPKEPKSLCISGINFNNSLIKEEKSARIKHKMQAIDEITEQIINQIKEVKNFPQRCSPIVTGSERFI